MNLRYSLVLILTLMLLGWSSCDKKPFDNNASVTNQDLVEHEFTRGGAPLDVIVKLSQQETELTGFLTITVESRFQEGIQVSPPYLSESVYQPLLLVDNPKEETVWSEQEGKMVNRWTYRFEPTVSGEFTLKPFSVKFRLEKEKNDNPQAWPIYQVETDPIAYKIKAMDISNLDDIRDIKGLIYPPYRYQIPIITLACLIGLVLAYLGFIRRSRRGKTEIINPRTLIDYYHESLNRLQELEQRDLINKAEFEKFHTELTSILRDYLEYYFGLRAREQTSQEFIQEIMETRQFTTEQRHELERFLQLADLVKFATFQPGLQISQDALNNVRAFIQTTGKTNED